MGENSNAKRIVVRPQLNGAKVETTDIDCPLCAAEGNKNIGRRVPKLNKVLGNDDPFRIGRHGYISADELA